MSCSLAEVFTEFIVRVKSQAAETLEVIRAEPAEVRFTEALPAEVMVAEVEDFKQWI